MRRARYGVHSALPLAIAHRRCPQAILIPRDIGLYRRASRKVMDVLRRFSDRVEVAGLDEAYLDLSDCPAPEGARPPAQARGPRRDAPGLLGRPGAQQAAGEDRLRPRKAGRPLRAGAGAHARGRRRAPGDPDPRRRAANGRAAGPARGPDRGRARRGRSPRRWSGPSARGSAASFATAPAAATIGRWSPSASRSRRAARRPSRPTSPTGRSSTGTLDRLAESLCRGLAEGGYAGRTVTLKIRLRPFRTHTRSRTVEAPIRDPERVRSVARQLLAEFELDAPVRLLGDWRRRPGGRGWRARETGGRSGRSPAQEALTLDL